VQTLTQGEVEADVDPDEAPHEVLAQGGLHFQLSQSGVGSARGCCVQRQAVSGIAPRVQTLSDSLRWWCVRPAFTRMSWHTGGGRRGAGICLRSRLSISPCRTDGWLAGCWLLLVLLADVTNSHSHHCKPRPSIHLHLGRAEFTPRKIRRRAATDAAPLAI
jgi:hypothetical protein